MTRFISFHEAANLSQKAAHWLRTTLNPPLEDWIFAAIPRSGLFVLGYLSYLLALDAKQLAVAAPDLPAERLVLVDDCCLSGARFAQVLAEVSASHVVFVHLLSPAPVRKAILEQEPRVRACFAAQDLRIEQRFGEPGPDMARAVGGRRFWIGETERFAFAWGEPDQLLWNQQAGLLQTGWHATAPHRCLENRGVLPVDWRDVASGARLESPAEVYWRLDGEDVWLWHSTRDQVFQLSGSAARMWCALIARGSEEGALDYLQRHFEVEVESLCGDLGGFTKQLREQGLLITGT